jgi:hypothetical protein
VGDRIVHPVYGEGEITHVFNVGAKLSLVVRFPRRGQRVVDPLSARADTLAIGAPRLDDPTDAAPKGRKANRPSVYVF